LRGGVVCPWRSRRLGGKNLEGSGELCIMIAIGIAIEEMLPCGQCN
jgi:hypothetical protein